MSQNNLTLYPKVWILLPSVSCYIRTYYVIYHLILGKIQEVHHQRSVLAKLPGVQLGA